MNANGVLSPAPMGAGTGGYPSMLGLLPPKLEIHHALLPDYFSNSNCRLVMGIVVADDEAVYLIHPAKSPKASIARVCPQEKAEYDKDGMVLNTILRGLEEELGLRSRDVQIYPHELSRFENHLPLSRTGGVPTTKIIPYFAARVSKKVRFVPNPKEVRAVVRVTEHDYLDCGLASRESKSVGQMEALLQTILAGVLDKRRWTVFAPHLLAEMAAIMH